MGKIKASLPNILTFTNLSLGIIAILMAATADTPDNAHKLIYASLLIIVAALADRFDGQVARKFNVETELGKELDSLSDLISFGVAPIIIAWKINFMAFGVLGYLIVLIFPIAGAYRLAKYNITEFDNVFRGIPITVAGGFLSIYNIYSVYSTGAANTSTRFDLKSIMAMVLIFILAFLMVSKVKIKKR